jgi:hypothetical protein
LEILSAAMERQPNHLFSILNPMILSVQETFAVWSRSHRALMRGALLKRAGPLVSRNDLDNVVARPYRIENCAAQG